MAATKSPQPDLHASRCDRILANVMAEILKQER